MQKVSGISISPVKALSMVEQQSVRIEDFGVPHNRLFVLIDEHGESLDDVDEPRFSGIRQSYDPETETLELTFPDGASVSGDATDLGEAVQVRLYGKRPVPMHVVRGPWEEALSSFSERRVRLARCVRPGDGNADYPLSLMSDASLAELARRGSADGLDARRFRMLFRLSGCEPHEEDSWIDLKVRVGDALIRPVGKVARCRITTQDPDTGVKDFEALKVITSYRTLMKREGKSDGIPFGIHAVVESPGTVGVGDVVELL